MRELKQRYVLEQNPKSVKEHIIQSNGSRRRIYRRLALFFAFAFIVIVSLSVTFYKQNSTINAKEAKVKELEKETNVLTTKGNQLKDEIQKLHDENYVLEIARRDYYFSKPEEIIFPISK
ncbi:MULTISPECIES: septum formation initiator family protein [unclassified Bacillus (in: firmicutes)]|uniref:FtsB family cell division protein n=1 Tax=unclassified Bacillus (in: firmicutes) TaxID=185979 RepID=UPI0008F1991A|nr:MULTISPECIES: septum formation initiator family protein [unclassified Bacillus (in: firmicutes)]SFJ70597.1 cell division protein DivIC [Bacillus sp. 71mf]SFT21368.1 cell division protein DivIC [Bacillus sp. 103mf]